MKTQQKKKVFCKQNIPNMLLVLRMVLAVVVVILLIADNYTHGFSNVNPLIYTLKSPKWWGNNIYVSRVYLFFLIAGCLFVLAAITDWLDGFIARKFNWVSDFGKFWDPIADKVLVNSVLICFAWHGYCVILIPVIMIARDVMVDAQKMIAAKKKIVVAANFWGKCKTVLQMVGIVLIFFIFANNGSDLSDPMYWSIQQLMLYLATVMSVVSGVIYFKQIHKAINHAKQH